jgi:creatinine amidohydrolase
MSPSIFDETMVEMAWPEIEKAAEDGAIVLLPTGVIEEHGPHMGLGVDTYCSYLACRETKRNLEGKGIGTLIAPPYYWGINTATGSFPGSFTVRPETMKALIYDILACLRRWGFTYVFNINWHGDHNHNVTILEAVKEARNDTGVRAYCVLSAFDAKRFGLTGSEPHVIIHKGPFSTEHPPKYLEVHAESIETGIMSEYFPEHVDIDLAKTLKSTDLTFEDLMKWRRGWDDSKKVTPLGYFGDPASFDPETAKALLEGISQEMADLIELFLKGQYDPPNKAPKG